MGGYGSLHLYLVLPFCFRDDRRCCRSTMTVTSYTGLVCLLRPDEFDVPLSLSIAVQDEPRDLRKQVAGRRQ